MVYTYTSFLIPVITGNENSNNPFFLHVHTGNICIVNSD